jgi:hypothetical protein
MYLSSRKLKKDQEASCSGKMLFLLASSAEKLAV